MDGFDTPNHSPVPPRNGMSLLQQVRGRYIAIHYDVEGLLARYVRLLEQLQVTSSQIKTCKVSTMTSERQQVTLQRNES